MRVHVVPGTPPTALPLYHEGDRVYPPADSGKLLGTIIRGRDRFGRYLVQCAEGGLVVVAFEWEIERLTADGTARA